MRSTFKKASLLLAALLVFVGSADACTVVMAGKKATANGEILVSYTCDGWYDHRLTVVPGKTNAAGAKAPVYYEICHQTQPSKPLKKVGEIPEAAKTYTYFHAGYPLMNEKSVIMGEYTWGGRDENECPTAMMMIEQLEVFGLQRGATAREAIKVMGELAEKYGYADGGEALAVADKDEVWLFEITGPGPLWNQESGKPGAIWAAQRVPDDMYGMGSNRSRIGEINFNDKDNFMYSSNIREFAKDMGWWKQGEKFIFHKIYNPAPYGSPYYQQRREWRAYNLLSPSVKLDPNAKEQYPLFQKPDKLRKVQDLMAVCRDYLEGTRFDLTQGPAAGPFGTPTRYATGKAQKPENRKGNDWDRPISLFRCSYSMIGEIRPNMPEEIAAVLWFGLDQPHTSVYMPVYAGTKSLPKSLNIYDRAKFNQDSTFWAFNFVGNWADLKHSYMIKDIRAKQSELEKGFFSTLPATDKAFMEKYKAKNVKAGTELITKYVNDNVNKVHKEWWDLAWYLVGKYSDGYVIDDKTGKAETVGYPTEWLQQVGFGNNDAEPKK